MDNKTIYLSFINKRKLLFHCSILIIILALCSYAIFTYWLEFLWILRILWLIILAFCVIGVLMLPFNGLWIRPDGTMLFIPDIRIKRFRIESLTRVAIVFNEQKNKCYSATVKFVRKNGTVFSKNYAREFQNKRHKGPGRAIYALSPLQVEQIRDAVRNMDHIRITIVNQI